MTLSPTTEQFETVNFSRTAHSTFTVALFPNETFLTEQGDPESSVRGYIGQVSGSNIRRVTDCIDWDFFLARNKISSVKKVIYI